MNFLWWAIYIGLMPSFCRGKPEARQSHWWQRYTDIIVIDKFFLILASSCGMTVADSSACMVNMLLYPRRSNTVPTGEIEKESYCKKNHTEYRNHRRSKNWHELCYPKCYIANLQLLRAKCKWKQFRCVWYILKCPIGRCELCLLIQ